MNYDILQGDCLETMRGLPSESVQCVVTSPPYFGLRSYLDSDDEDKHLEIGTEESPADYVAKLVEVFREVRRLLHPTGTIWVNLGDSYNGSGGAGGDYGVGGLKEGQPKYPGRNVNGLGPKQLLGIPWRVAFALQADGWILRSDIIWNKTACMPESVQDRCTKSHEYVFLLAKSERYFFDQEAIREPYAASSVERFRYSFDGSVNSEWEGQILGRDKDPHGGIRKQHGKDTTAGRNKRSVWTLGPEPSGIQHFAVMPTKLVEPCILAGTSARGCCAKCGAPWARVVETPKYPTELRARPGDHGVKVGYGHPTINTTGTGQKMQDWRDAHPPQTTGWQPTCACQADVVPCTVLDPFSGSGTVGAVALKHGRKYIGCELNEDYITLSHRRIQQSQPMLLLEGV